MKAADPVDEASDAGEMMLLPVAKQPLTKESQYLVDKQIKEGKRILKNTFGKETLVADSREFQATLELKQQSHQPDHTLKVPYQSSVMNQKKSAPIIPQNIKDLEMELGLASPVDINNQQTRGSTYQYSRRDSKTHNGSESNGRLLSKQNSQKRQQHYAPPTFEEDGSTDPDLQEEKQFLAQMQRKLKKYEVEDPTLPPIQQHSKNSHHNNYEGVGEADFSIQEVTSKKQKRKNEKKDLFQNPEILEVVEGETSLAESLDKKFRSHRSLNSNSSPERVGPQNPYLRGPDQYQLVPKLQEGPQSQSQSILKPVHAKKHKKKHNHEEHQNDSIHNLPKIDHGGSRNDHHKHSQSPQESENSEGFLPRKKIQRKQRHIQQESKEHQLPLIPRVYANYAQKLEKQNNHHAPNNRQQYNYSTTQASRRDIYTRQSSSLGGDFGNSTTGDEKRYPSLKNLEHAYSEKRMAKAKKQVTYASKIKVKTGGGTMGPPFGYYQMPILQRVKTNAYKSYYDKQKEKLMKEQQRMSVKLQEQQTRVEFIHHG